MTLSSRLSIVPILGVLAWLAAPAVTPSGSRIGVAVVHAAPANPAPAEASQQSDEARFSRKVQVGRDSSLTVSNISGDIIVRAGRSGEISIQALKDGSDVDRVSIDVAEHGGRVEVRTVRRGGSDHVSVNFTIAVPPDASVDLHSISGNIQVADVKGGMRAESVSGNVTAVSVSHLDRLKSVSGDVKITDGSADGDLSTGSVSGNVTIRNLKNLQGLELSTVSGDVALDGLACERASIRTVSGEIGYSGALASNGRYEISSHSGDIVLRLAGETGFEFDGTSFSGDIESDFPITIHGTNDEEGDHRRGPRRHAIHGTFGNASALLTVRSFSGDITIRRR
jgi:DUF4097 and DUF4098 domain-containing protein YvlB